MNELFDDILAALADRPKKLTDVKSWLFVTVNTCRALVDNTKKEDLHVIAELAEVKTAAELQSRFDMIQGLYGREGFTLRRDPRYFYLSSLAAYFEDRELTDEDRAFISEAGSFGRYLIYEI